MSDILLFDKKAKMLTTWPPHTEENSAKDTLLKQNTHSVQQALESKQEHLHATIHQSA